MSAIVFPGQGSQYPLMAMDFNHNFAISRDTFQEIEEFITYVPLIEALHDLDSFTVKHWIDFFDTHLRLSID